VVVHHLRPRRRAERGTAQRTHAVAIDYQVIRVAGKGLLRLRTKTAAGERTLQLPDWTMDMLWRRYGELGEGPIFPALPEPTKKWRDPRARRRGVVIIPVR
jgi:hypothetical protein